MTSTVTITKPIYDAASWLCGEAIEPSTDEKLEYIITLHILGLGARAINRGGRMWPHPYPWPAKEGWIREVGKGFDSEHPGFTQWRTMIRRAAMKERFVTNPYGRRAYNLTKEKAQMFLILSTANDSLKAAIAEVPTAPIYELGFCFVVTDEASAPAIAKATPNHFTAEVTG